MGAIYDAMVEWFTEDKWNFGENPEGSYIEMQVEGSNCTNWRCFARADEEREVGVPDQRRRPRDKRQADRQQRRAEERPVERLLLPAARPPRAPTGLADILSSYVTALWYSVLAGRPLRAHWTLLLPDYGAFRSHRSHRPS